MSWFAADTSDLTRQGMELARVVDDLRSALGALAPHLTEGVVGCGGGPASSAFSQFERVLTTVVAGLAGGMAEIGQLTTMAAGLYEEADASVLVD